MHSVVDDLIVVLGRHLLLGYLLYGYQVIIAVHMIYAPHLAQILRLLRILVPKQAISTILFVRHSGLLPVIVGVIFQTQIWT